MSTNNAETTQQQESQNAGGSFSIDLLPIADKDDKMELLSNLSVVSNLPDAESLLKLGFSKSHKGQNRIGFPDSGFDLFISNLNSIGVKAKQGQFLFANEIKNSGVTLFQVKEVEELGKNIFIKTTQNECYYGDFDEYLTKGVSALSAMSEGEVKIMKTKIKGDTDIICSKGLLKVKVVNKNHSIAGDGYCISDISDKKITVLKDNKLRYYRYNDENIIPEKNVYDLSDYGDVKEVSTDPNNNFYFIITQQEGLSKLRILNRRTLQEIQEPYENIKNILYMSHETGKLFCIDKEGYLRVILINTSDLERGYVDNKTLTLQDNSSRVVKIQDTTALKLKEALENQGLLLDENLITESEGGELIHGEIIELIWKSEVGESTLREMFDEADTIEAMDIVQNLFYRFRKTLLLCLSLVLQKV